MSSGVLSSSDFDQLQHQLLTLKTELYETRDRETKALKQRDEVRKEIEMIKANIQANGTNGSEVDTAAAGSSSSESTKDGSTLSNLLSSVKRNSVSLSAALSHATSGGSNGSSSTSSKEERLERELAQLRSQSANDAEESREQMVALKMNVQHLHKKALEMEKQNMTLMSHLSNLEEERQSLTEKREKELRRRQAKMEGRSIEGGGGEDEDEEDIQVAREKWLNQRKEFENKIQSLESNLTSVTQQLDTKEKELSKVQLSLSDEQKNFERILQKMAEKDDALRNEREENHNLKEQMRQMRHAANIQANNTHGGGVTNVSSQSQSILSPKSPSTFRSFFNKITDTPSSSAKEKSSNHPPPPTPTPTTNDAHTQQQPATSQGTLPNPSFGSDDTSVSPTASATTPSPAAASFTPANTATLAATNDADAAHADDGDSSSSSSVVPWSASDPLDVQVGSLLHEITQLKFLNEHLLASVSKKDTSIRMIQDDCERVMGKLAEREMEIHRMRDQQAGIDELKKELKKKDQQVTKLQTQLNEASAAAASSSSSSGGGSGSSESDSNLTSTSAAELKAATDAIAVVHQEFDDLKEQLENTKDMLFLAETQLIDKQKLLQEQSDTLRMMREGTEQSEKLIESLLHQKEKLEMDLNSHIDYLEKKCFSEVSEWEMKYDTDLAKHVEEFQNLKESSECYQMELSNSKVTIGELRHELDDAHQRELEYQTKIREYEEDRTILQDRLSELQSSQHIETRKRNTLVFELKDALKKELIHSKEAWARLKGAEDEITTLKIMNQHQIGVNMSGEETNGAVGTNGANAGVGAGVSGVSGVGAVDSSHHNGSNGGLTSGGVGGGVGVVGVSTSSHVKGVEQEVTVALAQKLAELQNDKHLLLKQKHSLEEHIDLLENDVSQKREMIRNLVRRIETGALSTLQDDGTSFQKTQFITLTPEAKQALFEKMEIITQETTLQNAQYKKNLQSMGEEITKLMEESERQTFTHCVT